MPEAAVSESATLTPEEPSDAAELMPDAGPQPRAKPTHTEAWAQLIAAPGHAPELLALAAVQTIGPRAQAWADAVRDRYPTAGPDAVARLAARQFTRFGSLATLFGAVAGSYAPIALTCAAGLTHAELVLHIAAAYGIDPTDEARATDLLVLTGVHRDPADAQQALAEAKRPTYEGDAKLTDAVRRFTGLATARTGAWSAIRLVGRYYPGAGLLAATLSGRGTAETVAARARTYYSQVSQALGSSV